MSPRNQQAYFHNLQCEATGNWPDDSRVQRNAGLIRLATTKAYERRQWKAEKLLSMKLDYIAEALGNAITLRSLS